MGFFLLFQLDLRHTSLFSIITVVSNNLQLSLSNILDNYYFIQKTSAETSVKNHNDINNTISIKINPADSNVVGAWTPTNASFFLQLLKGEEQKNAINTLLKRGFREYYFVMNNFEDPKSVNLTEELLKSADKTDLKIITILLPPSEGGPDTNYNWKGWVKYFNSLEKKHPRSFGGFTIDDFNWVSARVDTKFRNNIDFMDDSGLASALEHKSKDVKFYPTAYFEGKKTDIVADRYNKFADGLVVASGCYYNVSSLKKELIIIREIFEKPIKYVVYPIITHNYSRQDYSPPTDRLIMATLSIASNFSNGLVIWRSIDSPIIREYMANRDNKQYLSELSTMKELQIKDEEMKQTSNQLSNIKNVEQEINCETSFKKYNEAYNNWIKLPPQEKESNRSKKKILDSLK